MQHQRDRRAVIPEIDSVGRGVLGTFERAEPWTRQRRNETEKRMWNINGNIEKKERGPGRHGGSEARNRQQYY